MIRIKRTKYLDCIGNKENLMALSVLVWFRIHYPSGVINARSMNELRQKTHLHPDTINKRLATLEKLGFVERKGLRIRMNKLAATHTNRNIYLNITENDSIKDIKTKLYTYYLNLVNERKHFSLRMNRRNDCQSSDEIKERNKNRRKCKVGSLTFRDVGISYKYLSRIFGVARSTAQNLIKKAIRNGYVIKHNLFSFIRVGVSVASNILAYGLMDERFFTYVSPKGFIVRVYGNRYTCTSSITDTIYEPTLINMEDITNLYIK